MASDEAACFRMELKTVNYYIKKIDILNLKLRDISDELTGLSSIDFTKPAIENRNPTRRSNRIHELLDEEDRIIKERSYYQAFIDNVEKKFKLLDQKTMDYVADLYLIVENGTHDDIAIKHGYANRKALYRVVNKAIDKAFGNLDPK